MSAPDESCTPGPLLLYVGQQDTSRLLEVYVKRSLSLNDGPSNGRRAGGKHRKWVTLAERNKRNRRHSSDTSIPLMVDAEELPNAAFRPVCESQTDEKASDQKNTLKKRWMSFRDKGRRPSKLSKSSKPASPEGKTAEPEITAVLDLESSTEKEEEEMKRRREKKRKSKTKKPKSSFWKSIRSFFSRGDSDTDERDPSPVKSVHPPQEPVETRGDEVTLHRKRSTKKRRSRRKLSLRLSMDGRFISRPPSLVVDGFQRVEPTDSYYENVSDELKKIVTEVMDSPTEEHVALAPSVLPAETDTQSLSTEEVTDKLIALIKQQGDVLNAKVKESPSLTSFFQGLTYGSFQQLADHYVQSETPVQPVEYQVVAPELVKLAFTLDYTARVASLSHHSPSHIMGMGNRYLQDRFTYMTEAQPTSPITEPGPGKVHFFT
ncbi:hypothetical protein AALO_G00141610 [Alosa alosa]|uniref:Apoptosis facilitator Bcl-2-like protein 14 n=1 Tax=Alosa alosa TaxID=278164 RepID=A0AAV6GJ29_9TELE|nr:uncharacterized protein LOC125302477 [Alosa alosa]XP_048111639.1 uncharacterized protein LOC125302477 [Alosa alosa]XP_048111640.1 uncharacterized protein LOC125302477 [Alosa alosa]KAG5274920.1 hypothetical protein AALO_G00141610 [Alosa alosa]